MKITGGFHTKKEEKSDHHTRIWTRPVSVLELGWKEKLSFDARPRQLVLYTPGFHPQIQMQNLSLCEYKPFLFQYPPSRTLHAPEYLATLTPGHIRITTSPLGTMPVPQCLGVNMNIDRSQTRPVWDDKRPDCLQNGKRGGWLKRSLAGAVLWQSHMLFGCPGWTTPPRGVPTTDLPDLQHNGSEAMLCSRHWLASTPRALQTDAVTPQLG